MLRSRHNALLFDTDSYNLPELLWLRHAALHYMEYHKRFRR